jgi:hypothetical protein
VPVALLRPLGVLSHWVEKGWSEGGAAAAKASYVPMLKEYAEKVTAAKAAAAAT